jgi:membrane associated rhomboid family serine protease
MRGVRHNPLRELLEAQGPLLGLVALIFGIYVYQVTGPAGWDLPFMAAPPVQVIGAWQHLREGTYSMEELQAFGTLVSYAFLHGSPEHVIGNMLAMWIFAALVAELLGHRWVFGIFFVTAVVAAISQVALNPESVNRGLGASGAVMGFEGFYLAMAVRWHLPAPHIWPMSRPISPVQLAMAGVIGIYFDFTAIMSKSQDNIAYGAHLGGFVGGLVLAALLPMRPRGATVRHH